MSLEYTFDAAGRRKRITREDGSYWEYEYNQRGEVIAGTRHYAGGAQVPGFRFTYAYDGLGNQLQASRADQQIAYTPNALKQYERRGGKLLCEMFHKARK